MSRRERNTKNFRKRLPAHTGNYERAVRQKCFTAFFFLPNRGCSCRNGKSKVPGFNSSGVKFRRIIKSKVRECFSRSFKKRLGVVFSSMFSMHLTIQPIEKDPIWEFFAVFVRSGNRTGKPGGVNCAFGNLLVPVL